MRYLALCMMIILPALTAEAQIVSPPPDEGATGSANADIRKQIRAKHGCTTIAVFGFDLEKCPAVPFGSYSARNGNDVGSASASDGSSDGRPDGGGPTGPGGSNPGNGNNDPGDSDDGGSDSTSGGDRGGSRDRSEDCRP